MKLEVREAGRKSLKVLDGGERERVDNIIGASPKKNNIKTEQELSLSLSLAQLMM